jgi:hypothetical protein
MQDKIEFTDLKAMRDAITDLVSWRRVVESYGHIARSSAHDGRPQVLLKGALAYKSFNTQQEAIDYAQHMGN